MPDRCQQLEKHLDAFVGGSLDAGQHQVLQTHAGECERCAALLQVVRGPSSELDVSDDVLDQVLASTSGRACQQSQSLLCDLVDGALPGEDDHLVRAHMQHCRSCSSIAQSLALLRVDLASLSELMPDAHFLDDVLAATSASAPAVPGFLDRLTATWNGLLQRPRFAWEAAWVGTAILLLLVGMPQSPLRGVPQNALAIAQTNPLSVWYAAQPQMERTWGWLRDDIEAGWNASGGKAINAVEARQTQWTQEHPQAAESWLSMQSRLPTLRQAVADGNLAQASYVLTELSDDMQNLWHGFRAAPNDSLGSPTPPDREEN